MINPINHGRPWTDHDVARLRGHAAEGTPLAYTAKALDRTPDAVLNKLAALVLPADIADAIVADAKAQAREWVWDELRVKVVL